VCFCKTARSSITELYFVDYQESLDIPDDENEGLFQQQQQMINTQKSLQTSEIWTALTNKWGQIPIATSTMHSKLATILNKRFEEICASERLPVVYPSSVCGSSSFDMSSVAGSHNGTSLFVLKITVRLHWHEVICQQFLLLVISFNKL
jgi:cellulase/cellobiase CelA1